MKPPPVVVKIGGATLDDASTRDVFAHAIAQLRARTPGGIVLVHGGGKAVDRHLDRLGFTTERREGIRITPPDLIDEIVGVLAGRVNKALVGALLVRGVAGVGLCLGDAHDIPTRKATGYAFDPGRVGEVAIAGGSGEARLLRLLLGAGYTPVLSSIGIDAAGGFLNVNADDAASGVAALLHAAELVLMTDVPGVLNGSGRVVPELAREQIDAMIASGEIGGGMIPKVRAALETARALKAPVRIMPGNDPEALSRWAGGQDVGTRILAS